MTHVGRRDFMKATGMAAAALSMAGPSGAMPPRLPNVLFVMTDQQRADTIAALGNAGIHTPNLDRLTARGVTFTHGYSTCPVCVPARYTIRTGCQEPTTGFYENGRQNITPGQAESIEGRCGPYLAKVMRARGYRTFGIGKFHTHPWDEDLGYDVHLHSEELYGTPEQRGRDAYASFIAKEHPEYNFVECLMGERTEMYYMPQMSPLPAAYGVEAWAADRAVEQIQVEDGRPFFGFVSFIGPHPPLAPPIPFNRMYDPDRMPNPVRGERELDHLDEQIPFMNHLIWAEDINDSHARALKARYYGEISYIDQCLGRILDAVDARPDAARTVICFFSDHGDHLGDHFAWQKESFFDVSCRIPFLVSWPDRLPANTRRDELVCLADLFGIATGAAAAAELREGVDVLGIIEGRAKPREYLAGFYGEPGSPTFKIMIREKDWKYIFMANGGREQLFNVTEDPHEVRQRIDDAPDAANRLRLAAVEAVRRPNAERALDENGRLRQFPFSARPLARIHQFDHSRGVTGFPEKPQDVHYEKPATTHP